MKLTEEAALRAYAKMLNTHKIECLEPILADDFVYESQMVLEPITSKQEFLNYMEPKLGTIQKVNDPVYAEMGELFSSGGSRACVVLAQTEKENLVALVFAKIEEGKLKRLDLGIAPPPLFAKRSGEYPGI